MRRWSTIWAVTAGTVGFVLGVLAPVSGNAWVGLFAGLGALCAAGFALVASTSPKRRPSHDTAAGDAARSPGAAGDRTQTAPDPLEILDQPGLGPVPASSTAADASETLTDPESGLYSEAYFGVALGWRVASARRHLRPVSVALVDVVEGLAVDHGRAPDPRHVAEAIERTLRDADLACRMGDGSYAFIFEDSPETGAVWTVERLRRTIVSRFGSHTMWAGIASYPAHGLGTDELVARARGALRAAHDWSQDRIEVAAPPPA